MRRKSLIAENKLNEAEVKERQRIDFESLKVNKHKV